jgi:hypothetical protein
VQDVGDERRAADVGGVVEARRVQMLGQGPDADRPTPAVRKPSTSAIVRPASASAPRAASAQIWNCVLSGAQRVGCS